MCSNGKKNLFDKPNILQSIQRQLHDRFILQTAGNDDEALRILQKEGLFAVIASNMRMPGISGIELLARVSFQRRVRSETVP